MKKNVIGKNMKVSGFENIDSIKTIGERYHLLETKYNERR